MKAEHYLKTGKKRLVIHNDFIYKIKLKLALHPPPYKLDSYVKKNNFVFHYMY